MLHQQPQTQASEIHIHKTVYNVTHRAFAGQPLVCGTVFHCTSLLRTPLSPSSAVILNHISSHFLMPLSDSSLICTVPAQWLVMYNSVQTDVEACQWLHSASSLSLIVGRTRLSTVGDRAFPVAAVHRWNSLPNPKSRQFCTCDECLLVAHQVPPFLHFPAVPDCTVPAQWHRVYLDTLVWMHPMIYPYSL